MDFKPKSDFAKGPNAAAWNDVVSSRTFSEAAGAAMLQMQSNLGMAHITDEAVAHCRQMEGARIYLSILMNLTTPPEEVQKRMAVDNLDHTV